MAAERALAMMSMRVHADTLEHFKRWAAAQPVNEKGKAPEWTVEARRVMSVGFDCVLGRCDHAKRAAVRAERLEAYIERFGVLDEQAPPAEGSLSVSDFPPSPEEWAAADAGPWSTDPLDAPEEPNSWVPVPAHRLLSDAQLLGKGYCLEHRGLRVECNERQLHDEGA